MTGKKPAKIEAQRSFPPLDESHYNLRPEDAVFFKELTGIEDDATLKQHILNIQAKAYKVASLFDHAILSYWFTMTLGCPLRVHLSISFYEVFQCPSLS
jgi:hypothetical protein